MTKTKSKKAKKVILSIIAVIIVIVVVITGANLLSLNNLVKKDFLEFLNLPADTSNEILSQKWEEYKKENDL